MSSRPPLVRADVPTVPCAGLRPASRSSLAPGWAASSLLALTLALAACGGGSDGDVPLPTASITAARSDSATQPGTVAQGGQTDDTTPLLSGALSAALAAGQKLQVYDGSTLLSPAATVSGQAWQFTPATALAEGEHRFSVAVLGADGKLSAPSSVFSLTVALPVLNSAANPSQAVRASPTTFSLTGSHWPSSGLTVAPVDDARATCEAPSNPSATSLQVACTLYTVGERKLELRLNGQPLGQVAVTVASNVSGVTWASASSGGFGTGTVRLGEVLSLKVSGSQLLADSALALSLEGCESTPQEQGTATDTERLFTCTLAASGTAGQKAGSVQDSAGGATLLGGWQVPVAVAPASTLKLPHSGITAAQCYQAGSDSLVACNSAGAIALSGAGKQDGMRVEENPLSYSSVGSYSKEECVKDNVTGLIWEGKTASGLRAGSNTYTHYDDPTQAQRWNGSAYVNPAPADIDAATNTVGYKSYVNSIALCGYTDWRLPTVDELQGLVDYSKPFPGPSINTAWFPNTAANVTWSSSPYAGSSNGTWGVFFGNGVVGLNVRYEYGAVRLVRASQ